MKFILIFRVLLLIAFASSVHAQGIYRRMGDNDGRPDTTQAAAREINLTANQVFSSTTPALVTGWQYNLSPNRSYLITATIIYNVPATTTGIAIDIVNPSNGESEFLTISSANSDQTSTTKGTLTNFLATSTRATTNNVAIVRTYINKATNPGGNYQIRIGTEVNASAVTVLPTSRLIIEEI